MADLLKYRLPGGEIISQSGKFEETISLREDDGFFVTDFSGNQIVRFVEMEGLEELHFSPIIPDGQTKEKYLVDAKLFLDGIRNQKLGKAVFSRVKTIFFDNKKSLTLFDELEKKYPNAFVYLISSNMFGTWVGATPEVLLKSELQNGFTMALAGTLPIDTDTNWGDKEKLEQQLVEKYIEKILLDSNVDKLTIDGPNEVIAGPVRHLRSDFHFKLNEDSPIELAMKLHPTPAVSGFPQKEALALIQQIEQRNRQFYAGMIGVLSKSKSDIYVNLRCCSIHNEKACLYLGGGFTKDSNPEKEWDETENKSKTLLNIFQKM